MTSVAIIRWRIAWCVCASLAALWLGPGSAPASGGSGPGEARLIYFGRGEIREMIPWRQLIVEDFQGEEPPAHLASHAGLIGAVSCIGIQLPTDASAAITLEPLPTGERRYVARLYRPRFIATFDRLCSWWNPASDDPPYLLHHEQIHFDIAEAAARRLSREVRGDPSLETRSSSESDALAKLEARVAIMVKKVLRETQERHERFDVETSDVRSRPRQQKWSDEIATELAEYETEAVPPAGS